MYAMAQAKDREELVWLRAYKFCGQLLRAMFSTGQENAFKVKAGWPEGTKIVDAEYEVARDTLTLFVTNVSFEPCTRDCIPVHTVICDDLKLGPENAGRKKEG